MSIASPGIDILNVGAGHLKFRFDKNVPEDVTQARKVLTQMLARGYMLFCIVDGEHKRIRKFDADRDEYILEEPDVPQGDATETNVSAATEPTGTKGGLHTRGQRRAGRPKGRRVPMQSTRATAIGPTAGG